MGLFNDYGQLVSFDSVETLGITGTYEVRRDGERGTIHVYCAQGEKSAQLSGTPASIIAGVLLAEILTRAQTGEVSG